MPNISASSYSKWHTCNRLWYWEHVVKLERAREEGPRRFGTLVHAGLESWWRTMDGGDVPWRDKDQALVDAHRAIAENAKHVATDPFDVTKAEVMMVAYHARYFELEFESVVTPIDRPGDNGVEMWFNLDLLDENGKSVPGWRLTGRKDALKKFADGRVKPLDHKVTSQKIHAGADYWSDISTDTQVSVYVDVTQRLGFKDADRLVYDVLRKPGLVPLLATPEEKRTLTKGKGCKECGGSAGGKKGIVQGSGKAPDGLACAGGCGGTGWLEAPRMPANQRDKDESWQDYAERIAVDIAEEPDSYFRMVDVPRSADQIAEARADMTVTAGAIGALVELARLRSNGDMRAPEARRCFPKNSNACSNQYGRTCDALPICSGEVPEPFVSGLYQIKKRS